MASRMVVLHTSPPPRMTFRPWSGRQMRDSMPRKRLILRRRILGAAGSGEVVFIGFDRPNTRRALRLLSTQKTSVGGLIL